jgi:Ulp1 family protease
MDYISHSSKLVIPLNWANSHWTFIGVDFSVKRIYSMDGKRNDCRDVCVNVLDILEADYNDRFGKSFDRSQWEIHYNYDDYPIQIDNESCGLYVILGSLMFLRGDALSRESFSDADMEYVRFILAYFLIINVEAKDFPTFLK